MMELEPHGRDSNPAQGICTRALENEMYQKVGASNDPMPPSKIMELSSSTGVLNATQRRHRNETDTEKQNRLGEPPDLSAMHCVDLLRAGEE